MRNERESNLEMKVMTISNFSFVIKKISFVICHLKMNNRYKTNKKWKKDCTVQPMSTMRVA